MTAAELAAELEVSERTVLRDVEALSASGVPVYTDRGRGGGIRLLPGYRTDLTGLTLDEAKALMAGGGGGPQSPAFASAMRKVAAALPEPHRDAATRAAQRILVRTDGFTRPRDPEPFLGELQHAVVDGQRVRAIYRAPRGEPGERILDPVGLVHTGQCWYLLARRDGVDRTYRVSRFESVEVLPEPAVRPAEVDLESMFQASRESFRASLPTVVVTVRAPRPVFEKLARTAVETVAEPIGDAESVVGDLRFADHGHAQRALWLAAPDAEALGPAKVRKAVAARAAALAGLHQDAET